MLSIDGNFPDASSQAAQMKVKIAMSPRFILQHTGEYKNTKVHNNSYQKQAKRKMIEELIVSEIKNNT